MLFISRHTFT